MTESPTAPSSVAPSGVSLVVPARNEVRHLAHCLASAVDSLARGEIEEIIVVDDGSTDGTRELAERYPVRVLAGTGEGPGAARNLGWRAARTPYIWFVDADCALREDSLAALLAHFEDPEVAAVGGSYGAPLEDSWLARVIQEEIAERHARMPAEVDFLATFNVVYRREVLAHLGGFDETLKKAQDAELAYRAKAAGYRLRFERRSRVDHFHESKLAAYLRVQRAQGYYRVKMYVKHPSKVGGDAYSGPADYAQPPLAMISLALAPTLVAGPWALLEWATLAALLALPAPMGRRLQVRASDPRMLCYVPLAVLRAYARGLGMTSGVLNVALPWLGRSAR